MSWGTVCFHVVWIMLLLREFFTGLSAEKAWRDLQPLCTVQSFLFGVCQLIHEDPSDQLSPSWVLSSSRKQVKLADLELWPRQGHTAASKIKRGGLVRGSERAQCPQILSFPWVMTVQKRGKRWMSFGPFVGGDLAPSTAVRHSRPHVCSSVLAFDADPPPHSPTRSSDTEIPVPLLFFCKFKIWETVKTRERCQKYRYLGKIWYKKSNNTFLRY